ncbi:MAG: diguanylate cyclase [Planctomycetes bacterium]|nr:diguanylate cyclase [Planctomycetota bacterium]
MKILVAEDDPTTRRMILKTLSTLDQQVLETDNGACAWEIYQRERPEIVITDWLMPGMDGLELVRRICESNEGCTLKPYILMLTAKNEAADLKIGFDQGASEFISKPFRPIELIARLKVGISNQKLARELERARRLSEQQALTDSLTGLNNRRALLKLLRVDEDRTLRGRQPLSVILTDVDHFKSVNDDFGHNTGDCVLQVVSDALRAGVRSGDHLGRWGGEEFLILLPNTDLIQAAEVAERCRTLLARQQIQTEDSRTMRISASFGVASANGVNRPDVMELVSQADRALYWAKEAGRNRVKIYVANADSKRRRA